ncbi:MAG: hypothetical protein J1E80_02780 [Desulfovibrionaceae bacterium]|nr:hypothetical protein [Desulfovibrionaceae bacterium]
MYKNIAIVLLACCCIYLVINQRMERGAWEERPLDASAYGSLIALRDVLPPAEYQKRIVPFLERAASGERVSYRQLKELEAALPDLGGLTLEAARRTRPQEELARAWENARQGASSLGDELNRTMRDMLDQLNRMVDKSGRSGGSAPAPQAKDTAGRI